MFIQAVHVSRFLCSLLFVPFTVMCFPPGNFICSTKHYFNRLSCVEDQGKFGEGSIRRFLLSIRPYSCETCSVLVGNDRTKGVCDNDSIRRILHVARRDPALTMNLRPLVNRDSLFKEGSAGSVKLWFSLGAEVADPRSLVHTATYVA